MQIKFRYKIGLVLTILAGMFLWGRCSKGKTSQQTPNPASVLPEDVKEQIIVDPAKHYITITRHDTQRTVTLPDKPTVIDIKNDNTVNVYSPQSGFEHRFFAGIQGSNKFRVAVGMDAFYIKKFDIGFGLASELRPVSPIIFVGASYNIYSNLRVGVTYGKGQFGGILTVRL